MNVKVIKMLYVCDKTDVTPPLLHITFMLQRFSGEIKLLTNEFDVNPIHDVKFIDISELVSYGFSEMFQDIVIKSSLMLAITWGQNLQ